MLWCLMVVIVAAVHLVRAFVSARSNTLSESAVVLGHSIQRMLCGWKINGMCPVSEVRECAQRLQANNIPHKLMLMPDALDAQQDLTEEHGCSRPHRKNSWSFNREFVFTFKGSYTDLSSRRITAFSNRQNVDA